MKESFKKFYISWLTLAQSIVLCLSLLGTSLYAQDPPQYGTRFAGVPDPRDVNMYQVNIRAYSAGSNLAGVTARLDNIKSLGINVVYLTPIFPVGTDPRSKIASSTSPYSIKDFKSVGEEYGTLSDFRTLVDGAHSRGMAVMMDWVVNQTSWDHPWITEHPDWYVRDEEGNIQQLASFRDVAALDMTNTEVRAAMIDAMRYWIFATNIDGFRFDYANNAPLEGFWNPVIANLRSITNHKLLLLAEGDRLENFTAGFDLNFGFKWYYDALLPIKAGSSVYTRTQNVTDIEYTHASEKQQVVRYTGNHDTSADGTPLEVFGGNNGVMANFIVSAYMKGVPFLYGGQEVAFPTRIPWPWDNVDIDWTPNDAVTSEFKKILAFRNYSTAIRRGYLDNYSDHTICAFTKIAGKEKVAVFANLRSAGANYVVPAALAGSYTDAFSGARVNLRAGASLPLTGFGYRVLTGKNDPGFIHVAVAPLNSTMAVNTTKQLSVTLGHERRKDPRFRWRSSNPAIATVDQNGLVTAVAAGSVTITVTAYGTKTATAGITVLPESSFKVYTFKPADWGTNLNIYYWDAEPEGTLAPVSWPGVSMTDEGEGWYSHTFNNVTYTNLIFNDGAKQTANLNRNKTGWFVNGVWFDTKPETSTNIFTVHFFKPEAWGTGVNIYYWDAQPAGSLPGVSWPGVSMTDEGDGWYSYTFYNALSTNLIFNDGSNQTGNLFRSEDGWYKSGVWYNSKPEPGGSSDYYLIANRWQGNTFLYDGGTGVVNYGTDPSTDNYQWQKINAGGGFFVLKNKATGNLMHVEDQNGTVQSTALDPGWWSAMWSMPEAGDGWVHIFNRWQSSQLINIEALAGYAQYAGAAEGWWSAQWQLVAPGARMRTYDSQPETDEEATAFVEIYPNPSSGGQFYITVPQLPENEMANVAIQDVSGKIMLQTKVKRSGQIMHNLVPGLYFVRVRASKVNAVEKVVIE